MEKILDKDKKKEKTEGPRIYIDRDSKEEMQKIADKRGIKYISHVYQEAIDLYLELNEKQGKIEIIKSFVNKI